MTPLSLQNAEKQKIVSNLLIFLRKLKHSLMNNKKNIMSLKSHIFFSHTIFMAVKNCVKVNKCGISIHDIKN